MRGTSLASRDAVLAAIEPALSAAGAKATTIGEQLLEVVDFLDDNGAVRRALTDPAREDAAKAALVRSLFGERLEAQTVDIVADAAARRWSGADDFVESVERFAFDAILIGAKNDGRLEEVSQELWRASQAMIGRVDIRTALTDARATAAARADLLGALFAGKVSAEALVLIRRVAAKPRGRHVIPFLQHLSDLGAQLRNHKVAHVTVSAPISPEQVTRIEEILQRRHGQDIQVDVSVDPKVVGGIRIQVGADVLDQTLLARLKDVRREIAS
ncbi:F0F1 ATP synthase subunit delta [Rarobacter faecitabidus]|uniref:ATP synthase subunit delta n=1 Tax=Rarobacter faecitabidus TaxID=13243 RepID=A0A542ZX57_RARFA|nr:F0F1 ATP synthase subunit delta [Rarobacter faecitabidus]TQL64934.1 ATP synthase F1 subcomplex delta subunit [Rarobacter faecitabidus]